MNTRITIDQLERMKTHELAELLANVVLILKRLPNVECRQLQEQPGVAEAADLGRVVEARQEKHTHGRNTTAPLTREELSKKKVAELKDLATELHISFPTKTRKEEFIEKILAKQTRGHSEQYAIQNI